MDFSTSFELWLVGCSMLFGAAGMLLYDGFRIWRQLCPAGRAALFLQDLLFWLLLSAGVCCFSSSSTRGSRGCLFSLRRCLARCCTTSV